MYEVYIDDSLVDAVVDKIIEQLNGDEVAYIILENNDANRELVQSDRDVEIKWYGETVFKGKLVGAEFYLDRLRCIVYNSVYYQLNQKIHSGTYEGVEADTILSAIASDAGVTAGDCPTDTVSIKFVKTNCLTAVKYLAYALNKDFYTTDGTINIGTKGSTKGTVTVLSVGRRVINRAQLYNRVIVRGYDANGNAIEGQADDTDSQSQYGVRTKVFFERRATDVTTLQRMAQQKLDQLKLESIGSKIVVPLDEGVTLSAGDTVTVNQESFGLSGSYRIRRITKKADRVELELESEDKDVSDYLREQFTDLEALGIYPVVPADQVVIHAGTDWPSSPTAGQLFYRTDLNKLYRYNGTDWELVVQANSGTAFPTTATTGELFYREDENTLYRYDGSNWVAVHALSTHGTDFPASPRKGDFFYNTSDGYLYRYDGSNWIKVMHQAFGSDFPVDAEVGDTFYHSGYEQTFYYDGTNWVPLATIARAGTEFPTNKVEGDVFYRTDLNQFFRFDGSNWVPVHPRIDEGTSFPANPQKGDLFYRTDENLLYRYDGSSWVRVVKTTGEGTAFPSSPKVGDLFYRTDENVLYRYDGSSWNVVQVLSTHGTEFPSSPRPGDFFYKTDEGYLYRYDGSNWVKVMHQAYGDSFPASPEEGDTFYHTGYEQTFYYNGTQWVPLATIARQGTSFPANAVDGDIFYRTDEEKFYRYNGSNWTQIAAPKLEKLQGQVLEEQIAEGAVSLGKLAAGVAGQPSEELETVVETKFITDIEDPDPAGFTTSTSYVDQKSYSWSISALGQEYETTTVKVRFHMQIHAHKDVPAGEIVTAYARVLEDGVAKAETSFQIDSGSDGDSACTTYTSDYKELSYSTTKSSAQIKIQIKISDGTYYETRVWADEFETIQIQHKHRYKKYGVIKP